MKPNAFLMGLGALSLIATASADVTINVTGATAFRSAALTAIRNKYTSYKYGADNATLTSSTRSIFVGAFPGISGITTIRCCFTGSVEGIRALSGVADSDPPTYYPTTALDAGTATPGGTLVTVVGSPATAPSDIAFSDVNKTSTPYGSAAITGVNPGVIVFSMVTNEGSPITNVTSQQFRALVTDKQPLSLFTGNASDTTYVCAVGRNDGSGTRTTYLAETGFGITKPVNQFLGTFSGGVMTKLQLCPAGGATASTVWGQDVAGNGGYTSGGTIASLMGCTGASVQIVDNLNNELASAAHTDIVTWLGTGDAAVAKNNGAVVCAYNGVSLDFSSVTTTSRTASQISANSVYKITFAGSTDFTLIGAPNNTVGTTFTATGAGTGTGTVDINTYAMSATDKEKIYNGSYTAWGYERMFRKNSASSDVITLFTTLNSPTGIPANLGTAGVATTDMLVQRTSDGGLVAP